MLPLLFFRPFLWARLLSFIRIVFNRSSSSSGLLSLLALFVLDETFSSIIFLFTARSAVLSFSWMYSLHPETRSLNLCSDISGLQLTIQDSNNPRNTKNKNKNQNLRLLNIKEIEVDNLFLFSFSEKKKINSVRQNQKVQYAN